MRRIQAAIEIASAIVQTNEFFKAGDTLQNNKALLANEAVAMLAAVYNTLPDSLPLDDR